ncbi:CHAT domain-containing protein [Microcoleus sp. CAWBG58]|uniref:CHAT domain-containing protein n=1 Tax=Microcoleus sp. CAWBG58 TaxID=2841651 RepID=UPI0025D34A43|nr:CHAT domain-containing tetratricopeptide repeat protein [Microcoleus sp. CAWBG58]
MEENRIAAYLQLIHTLLNCPNGDEPQILQDNSELLDRGFLETCESVAAKLAAQGGENGANFLRNLASQLGQFIDMNDDGDSNNSQGENPQEYVNFILELLQAEADSKGDIKVIYPMLARRQHLLNLRFAEILPQVAERLLDGKNPETISSIVGLIGKLSIDISNFPRGNRANNIEIAIAGYQIVLSNREQGSEKWAGTQNELANAYSDRIRGEKAENIELAIASYTAALSVYTRDAFPANWAITQSNLANVYRDRIRGDRAENIELAITSYQLALQVRTYTNFPQGWAITQNNLGIAYNNRIWGDRAENLELAIESHQFALKVHTRVDFPEDWAMAQHNLGNTYLNRIRGDKAKNLEQAITSFDLALQIRTHSDFPQDWAMTQDSLGSVYSNRIWGDRAKNIELAIKCYQSALQIYTYTDFPVDWARTQNKLGVAYRNRIQVDREENLELAIKYYTAALSVYTRDAFPEKWADTQNNLANAYCDRISGEKADNIERAITSYTAALSVYTHDAFPEKWAMTHNNLATAYYGKITGNKAENIKQAIASCTAALEVRTREQFPIENVRTLCNLGWIYLTKLDHVNLEQPEDTNQKASTLQSAYDTFKKAITGATNLRKLIESGDETKQKHDLQWDRLYEGMVQVCLDRKNNQEALLYAEANKARNLAEVIAQKQETPQVLQPITFTEITQLLTPDTALIEWYITDKEIITFVVTYPDVLTVHRNPQCDELIDLVNDYRADYKQSKTHWQTKLSDYLQRLAKILQITTILPKESTRLILIPHWLLHLFPLHALPLTDDEFVLDRFTQGIQYSPSCQLLQQITIHPNFDQLLALQNPTSDLPYTDLEVASIAPKFAISQILPGSEASKTNLLEQYLEQLENAHCAHFSCHGSFNADEPLKSFLILSGGIIAADSVGVVPPCLPQAEEGGHGGTAPTNADENNDSVGVVPPCLPLPTVGVVPPCLPPERHVEWREGKTADIDKCLTLAEIFGLRFKQCRLVVLSACETALIDTQNRSDYIGLPTGFLYAGAMGTLASLWAVNDLSTALMMVKFYEVLKPGVSIGQALHDTQRWFKSATASDLLEWVEGSESFDGEQKEDVTEYLGRYPLTKKPYGDVYHWGAFCAIGL